MAIQKETNQKEYIKTVLAVCHTDDERRGIFFDFVQDLDYPRSVILAAFKEAGVSDDMSLRTGDEAGEERGDG